MKRTRCDVAKDVNRELDAMVNPADRYLARTSQQNFKMIRIIKTKLLQKAEGRKRGKYRVTLELSDNDIDMMEDLAYTYCTKGETPDCEFKEPYNRWTKKLYRAFHILWCRYDD